MNNIKEIKIDEYNYPLPDNRIALYPVKKRDESKLLVLDKDISHDSFLNLSNYLPQDNLLVFNNTKVIQARILFQKETGAQIEIFCLEPHIPSDYNHAFQAKNVSQWKCIVGNSKKWKSGLISAKFNLSGTEFTLTAKRIEKTEKESIIEFAWTNNNAFGEVLETIGKTPIPPYIKRNSEVIDKERYQTIYSKFKGSVAAPTAGLHFTDEIFAKLKSINIQTEEVTLHVGAGTFQPVKSENIGNHPMHTEHFLVSISTINNLLKNENNIISVGTTTVRTLESIYWFGVKALINKLEEEPFLSQWEVYDLPQDVSFSDSLNALKSVLNKRGNEKMEACTQIMIVPGYQYRVTNHLITNFHQPRSTLLLLVGAAIGNKWKEVYDYALKNDFRFLSYGDSCLFLNINKKGRN